MIIPPGVYNLLLPLVLKNGINIEGNNPNSVTGLYTKMVLNGKDAFTSINPNSRIDISLKNLHIME
jgi:hypothetical protein